MEDSGALVENSEAPVENSEAPAPVETESPLEDSEARGEEAELEGLGWVYGPDEAEQARQLGGDGDGSGGQERELRRGDTVLLFGSPTASPTASADNVRQIGLTSVFGNTGGGFGNTGGGLRRRPRARGLLGDEDDRVDGEEGRRLQSSRSEEILSPRKRGRWE